MGRAEALDSNGKIAEVDVAPNTCEIRHVKLFGKTLRFECRRCATFCCKLGGPRLSSDDVERLKKAGLSSTEFLDAADNCLLNTASGSCIYLGIDSAKKTFGCTVYPHRPARCRLYPFHVEKVGLNKFVLRLMPCKGISRSHGVVINEHFVTKVLVLFSLDDLLIPE